MYDYSQAITATEAGYQGAFTFALTAGTLPPGLNLATGGTLGGTPTAAGASSFTIKATDSYGFTATQAYAFTVARATPSVRVTDAGGTYNDNAFPASATAVGVDGVTPAAGSFGFLYYSANSPNSPLPTAPSNAGAYIVLAIFRSSDPNYTGGNAGRGFIISPATLRVTAKNASRYYGVANPTFTGTISGFVNGENASVVSGTATLTTAATAGSAPKNYDIAVDASPLSAANYTFQAVNGTLTVNPAPLSATGVNFNATAGAPFSGTVATCTNADPYGGAASYTALITWGDGSTSAGTISGTGSTLTVTGSHTYADPVNQAVSVQISHKLVCTTTATVGDNATVSSLGQSVVKGTTGGVGIWNNKSGQALINSSNGGSTSTALANWLAATLPNLYGASAGGNNRAGKTNAQVAAFYLTQFKLGGTQVQAHVLAVALNVYATTSSLGGTVGMAYGFTVSATGLGARSYSVGKDGAAFGVANNTALNVYELLLAVNKKAVKGVLYNGDATLQAQAADLFNSLNKAGTIP